MPKFKIGRLNSSSDHENLVDVQDMYILLWFMNFKISDLVKKLVSKVIRKRWASLRLSFGVNKYIFRT